MKRFCGMFRIFFKFMCFIQGSCRALTSLVKKKAKLIQSAVKGTEPFLPLVAGDEYERRCALYTGIQVFVINTCIYIYIYENGNIL